MGNLPTVTQTGQTLPTVIIWELCGCQSSWTAFVPAVAVANGCFPVSHAGNATDTSDGSTSELTHVWFPLV